MSKYLTLIPLLREMCFPAIIPGWWRKNYRKLKFLWLSFWANEQMWYGVETIFFLNYYSISPTLLPAFILDPWRKTFLYILSIIGFISVFMAGDKMAGHVNWPLPTSPAPTCLLFLFSHFRHTPPSIFMFFLNVIVKCSSEMTLNMCTLTEGIHLVIYFLPSVSCFFIIFFSRFRSIFTTSHIAHHLRRASTNGIWSSHCSNCSLPGSAIQNKWGKVKNLEMIVFDTSRWSRNNIHFTGLAWRHRCVSPQQEPPPNSHLEKLLWGLTESLL